MKKFMTLALAALMLIAAFSGCTTHHKKQAIQPTQTPTEDPGNPPTDNPTPPVSEIKEGGTLIIREASDPISFFPNVGGNGYEGAAVDNMFNRLVKLDTNFGIVPDAAETWDISEENKTITFHLKKNMHWWDGEALDADDVKYTFDYIKNHDTLYFYSNMKTIDSIEIVDPYTVVFHVNVFDMSFMSRLGTDICTYIVPEHIYNGKTWEDLKCINKADIMGSGPFMFESYTVGNNFTLVRNPNYHDGAPHLDKLVFSIVPDDATAANSLINGEIDVIPYRVDNAYVQQLLSNPDMCFVKWNSWAPTKICFNMLNPVVGGDNIAVRKAIALCIDRKEISDKTSDGLLPPEWCSYTSGCTWAANTEDTYPDIDIDAARKVLEDAGYKPDADGYYLRGITFDVFAGPNVDIAKLLSASCARAGIELKVEISEYNAWRAKVRSEENKYNWMIFASGNGMYPDPDALAFNYSTTGALNRESYSNLEFDKLCERAATELDQEKRAEYYKQAQRILVDDLPIINILCGISPRVYRADLANMPDDGAGRWGQREYTFTYFTNRK